MSTLAKLSKQAVQLEHDRQYEKALALFSRLFDEAATAEEDIDVALFNRAGDVAMRLGDPITAVRYYERAADAYAAGGLLNNAIAVCNKMLRQAPEHAATHHTLGVLHAKQGFRGDAKHHFVEYADRMHRAGRDDEAARALGEFAALCVAGDDVRAALAQHLAKGNRGSESSVRLQALLDATPSSPTTPAPLARLTPALATSAIVPAPPAADDRAGHLIFLDVSLDAVESAPVLGLESTAFAELADDASVFAFVPALDDATADDAIELETWGDLLPLTMEPQLVDDSFDLGAAPLELEFPSTFDIGSLVDDARVGAHAPRWPDGLPGELPMLSLAGWIGSAAPIGVLDVTPVAAPVASEPPMSVSELQFLVVDDAELPMDAAPLRAPAGNVAADGESGDDGYVDLGAWLRDDEPVASTRMTTTAAQPTGDEAVDFERMLGAFRAGVARNVDVEDFDSQFDLGVAFREMGLIDDAIAAFQKAARSPGSSWRAREAMGQCFLDRGSPGLAIATLQRVLDERLANADPAADDAPLVGVLYLLGVAHAQLGAVAAARACLERVVAADIQFRDAAIRLSQLSAPSP